MLAGLISKAPVWVPLALVRGIKMLVDGLVLKNDRKVKEGLLRLKRDAKYEALGTMAERWESLEEDSLTGGT